METEVTRASAELSWKADTRPMHGSSTRFAKITPQNFQVLLILGCVSLGRTESQRCRNALVALGDGTFGTNSVQLSRRFGEGLLARMINDDARARAAFMAARLEQEKVVKAQPDYGPALCVLGLIDAALGRKDEALREGSRAIELLPVNKDSMNGANMIDLRHHRSLGGGKRTRMRTVGDNDRSTAGWLVSYGLAEAKSRLGPPPGDPRFENIVASLAPKN